MAPTNAHIHKPGGMKQLNKSHKHWHKSKGALEKLNKGKHALKDLHRSNKHELKREERKNQVLQARQKKRFDYLQKRRGFCEAPFLVAILPLHSDVDTDNAISLLKSADPDAMVDYTPEGHLYIKSPRLKQKFMFVTLFGDNLFDQLDVAKVCTTVLLLASVKGISSEGSVILNAILAQGIPTTVLAVTDLESLPQKKWSEGKSEIQNEIGSMIPGIDKAMNLAKDVDAMNVLRKISSQKQRTVLQRDRRAHMLAERVDFIETEKGKGILKVTGYLRGCNLSANRLVHIPGWGEFQIEQIDSATVVDDGTLPQVLERPDPEKQESLVNEIIPDPMDDDQTWPTEEEMQECSTKKVARKLPKGMSEYQAAWIPDEYLVDVSEGDEDEDDNEDCMMEVASAVSDKISDDDEDFETVTMASEAPPDPDKYDAEMDLREEMEAMNKMLKAKEDLEFPDEVDTPQDIPARDRFARYRGIASFRTTPWDPKENLPLDYARIFQFKNFDQAKKKALVGDTSGVEAGKYITIHIKDVPTILYQMRGEQPIVVYGMLQNEAKMTVVNLVLKRVPDSTEALKSKETLMFQVGYRRFRASPIYSQHTSGNKHKYERFFQPDSVVVATVYAPVIFPPASVLVFKENNDRTITNVANGSVLSVNPNRIVVKRVVLSGHPFKVLKRSAVVRFMFFNRDDIEYFKPIELRTKHGRRGHIKEPLGTHGHMKCSFNTQLKSQDTVLMQLYKRVFPKWTYDACVNFAPILS